MTVRGEDMEAQAQRFGPDRKLPGKADFDRVFADARIRVSRHPFLILATPGRGQVTRLGIVVGKRHARRAVDRNRVRRIVRESFRQQTFAAPLDVVVLARPGAGACTSAMLAASLSELWPRLTRAGD